MPEPDPEDIKAIISAMDRHEAVSEEMLDYLELQRFLMLFTWVPFDCHRPSGMGRG